MSPKDVMNVIAEGVFNSYSELGTGIGIIAIAQNDFKFGQKVYVIGNNSDFKPSPAYAGEPLYTEFHEGYAGHDVKKGDIFAPVPYWTLERLKE